MTKIVLNPNCSVWVGKFNNRKYDDEYEETTNEKGEIERELVNEDNDVCIETDGFPNGGLASAISCIKEGFDIDDIEWENSGGGASNTVLEKDFDVARKIIASGLEFDDDEISSLDSVMWEEDSKHLLVGMLQNYDKNKIDDFAIKLSNVNTKFGKILVKFDGLKEATKNEIAKGLVVSRLNGDKQEDDEW